MPLPNFLIIGAAKSGTTALYDYLKQHPHIYMSPVKEPRFFAYEGDRLELVFRGPHDARLYRSTVTQLADYLKLFETVPAHAAPAVSQAVAIGEASNVYLASPKAAERIRHYLPQAKLIAILRQPAERAFSHYLMLRRDGAETLDFAQALRQEDTRLRQHWGSTWYYKQRGFYAAQLERYLALFPRQQIRVYLYDDWSADNGSVLKDICAFLEVEAALMPRAPHRSNIGGLPKSSAWHTWLTRPHPLKDLIRPLFPKSLADRLWLTLRDRNLVKPKLDPQIRAELTEAYREDIFRLQDLLGRDLSHWLKV